MTEPPRYWFIDAWAVLDGYAFASLRATGSTDASVTFFVAPPYFEPEPVASLATALAATRGHFQEGFYDRSRAEIAFDSLGQVVETVRRGYRAGGLDLDGTPAPSVPEPRLPPAPGEIHPASLVDADLESHWQQARTIFLEPTARREEIRRALAAVIERSFRELVVKFIGYSTVTMLNALDTRTVERSAKSLHVAAWIDRARWESKW